MVLYRTPYRPQSSPRPDQFQVSLCREKEGYHFTFVKLLAIGSWFHAYLIGEYWLGGKYYPHMWEIAELKSVI